jgi:hypothetical protein
LDSAAAWCRKRSISVTCSRYNEFIQASNNEELLLNLVRLRYLENPGFVPVSALTAQFEVDAGAFGRGGIDRGGASNYGQGTLSFADRPTITFAPQRSPELTKRLLTQIPLETLYLFSANGSDHARLLRLFVRNLNGIENAGSGGGPSPSSAPEFVEFRHVAEMLSHLTGYYVDDADTSSKITLGMFTDLFRLQRLGAAEGQPLLTLPVGR